MSETGERWPRTEESLATTLARTVTIAVVLGAVWAAALGRWSRWPVTAALCLWPSFGGHWVELFFLHALRPRLPVALVAQVAARVVVWLLGGAALGLGASLTASLAGLPETLPPPWIAAPGFVAIELAAHVFLWLRGRPSFYDGRG